MGVPTMLPDIMASGLQKPRSVIFARFCLSSWRKPVSINLRVNLTQTRELELTPTLRENKRSDEKHRFAKGEGKGVLLDSPEHFSA